MPPESHREYRDYVERAVKIGLDEWADDDYEDIQEVAHYIYDYDGILMNTPRCLAVLKYSDNEPDEWHHLVADGDSWRDVIRAMAWDVYQQDVWEELARQGEIE